MINHINVLRNVIGFTGVSNFAPLQSIIENELKKWNGTHNRRKLNYY